MVAEFDPSHYGLRRDYGAFPVPAFLPEIELLTRRTEAGRSKVGTPALVAGCHKLETLVPEIWLD
jgi:hypothetical protein